MPGSESSPTIEFFAELAAAAAVETLPRFRSRIAVDNKAIDGSFDPVTAADRNAERALRTAIARRYPDHLVAGEEFGGEASADRPSWVVDPIDGTRAYVCGVPTWGTLVAYCEGGRPVAGMMDQPYVEERFVAAQGRALLCRRGVETTLHAAATTALPAANLFATAPSMFAPGPEQQAFDALSAQTRLTRFGIDCYAYCLLAAGFIDLVVESGLGYYDIAPLIPLIEAAGGVVTRWSGAPVPLTGRSRVVAAANPSLHADAVAILGGADV